MVRGQFKLVPGVVLAGRVIGHEFMSVHLELELIVAFADAALGC